MRRPPFRQRHAPIQNQSKPERGEDKSPVVFIIRNDSKCSECGVELGRGSFLFLKEHQPLCLSCADLAHLEYLPRGDPALTRRARKHSELSLVVVEWSRTRKQYERQGALVEPAAIALAMEECQADAQQRADRQSREAYRRAQLDQQYVADLAQRVRELYPGCPAAEATEIAEHACEKYSGRVGRTAMARELDAEAVFLAVQAHIRHAHTGYDRLLMKSWGRETARAGVRGEVEEMLLRWQEAKRS